MSQRQEAHRLHFLCIYARWDGATSGGEDASTPVESREARWMGRVLLVVLARRCEYEERAPMQYRQRVTTQKKDPRHSPCPWPQ